ncbi:Glycine-rich RNA-binding protein 2, mitochondrial [Exophiala xenobiotica]|nr:Glycine-rich RNA-binding protein 2, mitochondrial [Exophiala xenobiotica]
MARVLLTGGSGFIAAHVLDTLLKRGYSVVTTVRSSEKADRIRAVHLNPGKERLDFVIVEDIAREGAFDDAVVSEPPFEAVIHTASPFHFNATDVQKDLLDPAIQGTTGILESIVKYAPTVRKVVITSSFAAMVNPWKGSWPEHTYSEEDWNPITLAQASESVPNGYRASKTSAERAAWDFLEREKPNFTLSTLCPPQVFGPVVPQLSSLDTLNTSNQVIRDIVQGKFKSQIPPNATYTWIDVRDLALCHVLALEKPGAANKRFFLAAGFFSNKELVEVVRKSFDQYNELLPSEDVPGGGYPEGGLYKIDNSRAVDILGIEWKSLDDSIADTVKSLQALGA